jgi:hypothetical protein
MKKMYPNYLLTCLGSSLIFLAACNKVDKRLKTEPLATLDVCQVTSMQYSYSSDTIGVVIDYNKSNDPVRITQTTTGTGHPDGVLWYNNKRQLTDYIGVYNESSFEFWHRYVYNNKGQVIQDTTYFFGFIDNGEPDGYYDVAIIDYEYDLSGRIAHTAQHWYSDPSSQLHTYYSYDGSGNLVVPGVTYDDKVAIHRTHSVWMFIDRNYSVNNGRATAWNTNGFPTHMNLSDQGGRFAGFYYGTLSNIQYQCDANGNGNGSPF